MNRTGDSLKSVQNETKLIVRLARSLKPGEIAVKLSLLEITRKDFFSAARGLCRGQRDDCEAVQGTGGRRGL